MAAPFVWVAGFRLGALHERSAQEFLRQFQEVERLPDDDKAPIERFLDAFLTKKRLQELAAR